LSQEPKDPIAAHFEQSLAGLARATQDTALLATARTIAAVIVAALRAGKKVLIIGNGGSAADAQHLAADFVGRYRAERQAFAAISLTTDTSALTAIGNDFGFEAIFARQLEALGKPGDVAVAISTSGNSPNVLRALESARKLGMATIGLSGKTGGKMRALVDICLCAPSDMTPRIQETHILIIHILSGIVENAFVAANAASGPAAATTAL
jgi:D-sedoheptulose 7-phosphate isomerase